VSLEEFIQTLEDLAAELAGVLNWDTAAEERETVILQSRRRLGSLMDETRQTT
jgi:hypothetical protein